MPINGRWSSTLKLLDTRLLLVAGSRNRTGRNRRPASRVIGESGSALFLHFAAIPWGQTFVSYDSLLTRACGRGAHSDRLQARVYGRLRPVR